MSDPTEQDKPEQAGEGEEDASLEPAPPTERPPPADPDRAIDRDAPDASDPEDDDLPQAVDDDALDRTTPGARAVSDPLDVVEALYGQDPEVTVNLTGDVERTVNLTGDLFDFPLRDDAAPLEGEDDAPTPLDATDVARTHLKGLLEALIFASDGPVKPHDLAKSASASGKQVKELLAQLKTEYAPRGIQLDEVAGGWIFRTSAAYAPFVRDMSKQKPVKLTRAQIETLAILAYRQPITRPEIDEIRGVDSGPVLKMLLERDLVKILGKKDEPGRPLLYGTTPNFLEFFGLKSLKDLPTLREFTELNEDSRRVIERELGETLETVQGIAPEADATEGSLESQEHAPTVHDSPIDLHHDTIRPVHTDDEREEDTQASSPSDLPTSEDREVLPDEEELPDDKDEAFESEVEEDAKDEDEPKDEDGDG